MNAVRETSSICTLLQITDYGLTKAKSLILCSPNGYKGLDEWLTNGKHGQGTRCTKMGADSLVENTLNSQEFICPSPKVWDFIEKGLFGCP